MRGVEGRAHAPSKVAVDPRHRRRVPIQVLDWIPDEADALLAVVQRAADAKKQAHVGNWSRETLNGPSAKS